MKIIVFVLLTLFCIINYGITSDPCGDKFEEETVKSKEQFTDRINDYALRLVQSSFDKTKENWFLFPINVISVLSTLYLGSNDTFADEFETMLRITKKDKIHTAFENYWKEWDSLSKSYTFETLDYILVNNNLMLSESYRSNVTKYYPKSILRNVSFPDSLKEINNEIMKLTKGSIKRGVSKDYVAPETLLFLISAAYLKAKWDVGFDMIDTREFYLQDKKNTSIPHESMFVSGVFNHKQDVGCDVVQLNMDNGNLSLFLIIPIKGKKIEEFNNNVESDLLKAWINEASFERRKINLRMPKASTEGILPLKPTLVHSLFDKELNDLSGMVDNQTELFADQYLQVGFAQFDNPDKKGAKLFDPKALSIEAVVPFVFFIVDTRTKMILLAGKYTNPPRTAKTTI